MDWIWLVMVVSFAYASLVVWGFGIELSGRIRSGTAQPLETVRSRHSPSPGWWVKRLLLIFVGYAIAVGITWFAHIWARQHGWEVANLATVFSASIAAIFVPPTFLLHD